MMSTKIVLTKANREVTIEWNEYSQHYIMSEIIHANHGLPRANATVAFNQIQLLEFIREFLQN